MSYGSVESQASYVSKYGDTMLGELDMNGNKLSGLPNPIDGSDAVNLDYLNSRELNGESSWEFIGSDRIMSSGEISVAKGFGFYNKILISVTTGTQVSGTLTVSVGNSRTVTSIGDTSLARNSTSYVLLIPFYQGIVAGLPYGRNTENFPAAGTSEDNIIYLGGTFNGTTTVTAYGQVFK